MRAVIALGSNLGDRQQNLDTAIALLKEATEVVKVSSYIATEPVGGPPQGEFLNAVCIAESELPAQDFLAMLHGIEKVLGRERQILWGPRTIDLDLISYGSILSYADELQLPHPRAHERYFVLAPWHEIEPDAILLTHGPIKELLQQLKSGE